MWRGFHLKGFGLQLKKNVDANSHISISQISAPLQFYKAMPDLHLQSLAPEPTLDLTHGTKSSTFW